MNVHWYDGGTESLEVTLPFGVPRVNDTIIPLPGSLPVTVMAVRWIPDDAAIVPHLETRQLYDPERAEQLLEAQESS